MGADVFPCEAYRKPGREASRHAVRLRLVSDPAVHVSISEGDRAALVPGLFYRVRGRLVVPATAAPYVKGALL